jgi:thiamine biosynthesis protein ThiI
LKSLILIKYSEIALKGKNQPFFIKKLIDNIKSKLKDIDHEVLRKYGRLYLLTEEKDTETATSVLKRIFGIYSFSRAIQTAKDITEIEGAAITLANKLVEKTSLPEGIKFKVEARRIDKSFPFTSYDIACRLGDKLRHTFKELKVDVNNPDWILNVEIRELAYLYGPGQTGPGGLPVGVSGKGMLLLSGGIDSPVAGYLMAKRGMNINAIYFHTYPFTSDDVLKKVKQIMKVLFSFLPKSRLFIVPFTDIQLLIKGKADAGQITLLSRACMMQIASQIAKNSGFHCLITGESLGKVSSP